MSKRNFLVSLDLNKNELLNPVLHNQVSHPSVAGSSGYTYFNTSDRTVYTYAPGNANSVGDWLNLGLPEGAGVTNLTYTASTRTLYSSTGTDVILPLADGTNAGLMTSAYFTNLANTSGNNTGDQTSIVGITGTKTQFNTALTDGDFLFVGDIVDANDYVSSAGFNTSNGTLTLTRLSGGTVTVNLDNRYSLTSHTHSYVSSVTGGNGIDSTGGLTPSISLNLSELSVATMVGGDWIAFDNAGVSNKALISTIPLSIFNNDSSWTSNLGTVTSVAVSSTDLSVAGSPITSSGTFTLDINANAVTNIKLADMAANTVKANPTSSTGNPQDFQLNTNSVLGRFTGDTTNIIIDNDLSTVSSLHDQLASSLAIKTYIDNSISGQLVYQGGYNAGTNTPNLETPAGGAINKGFTYTVTVSGDFFTEAVQIGDVLISEIDDPSTLADWTVVNKNIPDIVNASETEKGLVEEATQTETQDGTAVGSTGARLYVNPAKLAAWSGNVSLYPTIRNGISLTTTGTSGAATYNSSTGVFNIPNYANTTYNAATSTVNGLVKLFSDTVQTVAATAVSTTASRTYGLQFNSSGQLVVNVPWADTNTGVTTMAAIGSVPNANGASISTTPFNTLTLQPASASFGGVVTTGTQTFAGAKTFSSSVTSTVTTGTAPFIVASTTKVTNLNADLLDGLDSTAFALSSHNHTLDSLSNVTVTSNSSGEILKWNGSAWINNTLAEAGIQAAGTYDNYVSWTLAGDTGTSQTISSTNTAKVAGGTMISTVAGATGTVTVNHNSVTRTNPTSTASPAHGGTFTAIDSITTSSEGHVTAVNTKTVTLPTVPTTVTNKYVGLLSSASTSHAVAHGLGEQYVTAQVFDATTNEMVECEVVLTSSSITTFNFNVATTANQYRVVIIG